MRISKFLSEELLLITPAGYHRILQCYEGGPGALVGPGKTGEEAAKREAVTPFGTELEIPQMEIQDGIALIPISGPIGRGLDAYDKYFGATDTEDVARDLDDADDDDEVRAIVLCVDSPGGMVNGTPELADRIRAVDKPIYCYSPGLLCSAAYWIGCATDGIFATRSADIGSIGVYSAFLDLSKMAEQAGIKVRVFSSGTYKGMGVPGTALTKAQEELIQARIMEIAEMFYSHVRENRADVDDDDMRGQTFKAAVAAGRGLIDGVVADLDEVIRLL